MLRILHLEDDPVDADMILNLLREDGFEVEIDRVDTLASFREQLEGRTHSLILSDYTVPGVDALEALGLARQLRPEVPFLFTSGTIGEDQAIETLKLGASDYVLKQRLGRMVPSVRRALQEAEEQVRRRQAEAALRESERRLRGMFDNAGVGIAEMTGKDRFVAVNERACQILGRRREELLGSNVHELTWPEDRESSDRVNEEVRAGVHDRIAYEKRYIRGDGSPVWVDVTVTAVRDDQGRWVRSVTTFEDVTERKRAEETAQRAREQLARANAELESKVRERTAQLSEANANLQNFAYTAAHDLRSPLRTITSFAALLRDDYHSHLGPDGLSSLDRITRAATQMEHLLHDLLEYSKITHTHLSLRPVNLRECVVQALALMEADIKAKKAVVTVSQDLPSVKGHSATIVLLINNFLSNALKFVAKDRQPHISIGADLRSLSETPAASELPTSARDSHCVRLWVQDNGIGIAREHLDKIFVLFNRLHGRQDYPGTGLGLAIVKKGAERMDGSVGVETEVGKGSRFWFQLPQA